MYQRVKKNVKYSLLLFLLFIEVITAVTIFPDSVSVITKGQDNWDEVLAFIYEERDSALLSGDAEALKARYVPKERNSKWALEHELNRVSYLQDWASWRGIQFTAIWSKVIIKKVRKVGRGYAFRVLVSTSYTYVYEDQPDRTNLFRIGTYHSLDLIPGSTEGSWVISREWYLDPFQDPLLEDDSNTEEVRQFILAQTETDYSNISGPRKIALEYADRYAGAASDGLNGYDYNPEYPNYNDMGGDCSNYVSQILHESGYKTGGGWNYTKNSATRSWCNAAGLQGYLIWSGKAYAIAQGNYSRVYQASYQLAPGDAIAYIDGGRVDHMGFVAAIDSKGYPLVNTHTADRYHVPWDLGWNESDIKYILMKVNYPSG